MKSNIHNNSISINDSTAEASHKDAVTSTESHPSLDVEHIEPTHPTATNSPPTYASFYWLINYIKMFISRLANDVYTSFMSSWFPSRVLMPPHVQHLIQVQDMLRAERESHTVTYSSEDEACTHCTSKDLGYLANDREPMFVIVDSSCDSNPSSKELLVESRFHTRDPDVKRHFNKNVKPVDVPSTSRDHGNDLLPPLLMESDSTDEMQMFDINLQSDDDLLSSADSDCDSDSVVMSYLKNKDSFLDLEGTLMSTKKKASLLDKLSEDSQAASAPSYLGGGSSTSLLYEYIDVFDPKRVSFVKIQTFTKDEEHKERLKKAIEFLHLDNNLLIAAELGDENMIRLLIEQGIDINGMDHIGRNALHFAVSSGNEEAVAALLAAGVDPNVKDNLGMTPLSLCLMRSPSLRLASLLIDHGALIVPRIRPMDTGLFLQFVMMCVPTKEEEKILHLLVEKGAIINDREAPGGRQALHFAAMSNNIPLINVLVELGANLFAVNHRNQTPKQVAATFHCREAYNLLDQFEQIAAFID
ncbi:hypothetical protein PYW07_005236 [Mythimna separata]|uniref:Uncharacterized protein n=1 Tax=Mythimna separata TaxID=271217 RepID=A0AAD7YE00_MYTSE|nr:hypothetical protein PYW07_005236 [Mythimna separata]